MSYCSNEPGNISNLKCYDARKEGIASGAIGGNDFSKFGDWYLPDGFHGILRNNCESYRRTSLEEK